MASNGSSAWVAALVHSSTPSSVAEGADQVPAQRLERRLCALVVARRAAQLGGQQRLSSALELVGVELVHGRADVAQEGNEALARLAGQGLQLVTEDRRQAQRDRLPAQHLEQRQVHGGQRLPQPFLAEGPGAEAFDVGHVAVQDDCQCTAGVGCRVSGVGHRQMARKSSALSSGASRRVKSDAEIAGTKRS